MSMIGKLKQFKDLRKQAKEIQGQLHEIREIGNAEGGKVTIAVDGSQTIQEVHIADEMIATGNKAKLEVAIKDAHLDAVKKIQKIMAEKMRKGEIEMPDFNNLK